MFLYFKANDPYRLIGVILLLILIRCSFYLFDIPLLDVELKWLLIGERLASDDFIMYRDLWHHTAPLSVVVYKWSNILFGKTRIPFHVLSMILVIYQAFVFNNAMLKNKVYNQNTYVPAVCYMLLMNLSFDMFTLSPVLMSMTFILLMLNNLFKRMDNTTNDGLFISMGIYIGLATLFYLPSMLLLFITLFALSLYTGSLFRRVILMIYGFLITIILCFLYYYWHDTLTAMNSFYLVASFTSDKIAQFNSTRIYSIILFPTLLLLHNLYMIYKNGRYTNYQLRVQYVMLLLVLAGIGAYLLSIDIMPYLLMLFVPSLAFFLSHFLLTVRGWFIAELNFVAVTVFILLNNLFFLHGWINDYFDHKNYTVKSLISDIEFKDKNLCVFGNNIDLYQYSSLSTPFLGSYPEVNEKLNADTDSQMLEQLYFSLNRESPQVIIDELNYMPCLLNLYPTLKIKYRPSKKNNMVYDLVD